MIFFFLLPFYLKNTFLTSAYFFYFERAVMDFQNKSCLAIFIPQTNPLLMHMTKISTVGNVIKRTFGYTRSVSVHFISLNILRHGRHYDKLTAYTASWEGCKLVASEFSSGATKLRGFGKKTRIIRLFAEKIFL